MDKKSLIVVVLAGLLLCSWGYITDAIWPPRKLTQEEVAQRAAEVEARRRARGLTNAVAQGDSSQGGTKVEAGSNPAPLAGDVLSAPSAFADALPRGWFNSAVSVGKVETELMVVDFVAEGGGIRAVSLKKHRGAGTEPLLINDGGVGPLFQVRGLSPQLMNGAAVTRVEAEGKRVLFEQQALAGVRLRKQIEVSSNYVSNAGFIFVNDSDALVRVPDFYVNVGTFGPIHEFDQPQYIGSDWHDGNHAKHNSVTAFDASSFLGFKFGEKRFEIAEDRPLEWVTARNQFFVSLISLKDKSLAGALLQETPGGDFEAVKTHARGINTWAKVGGFDLPPHGQQRLDFQLYTGPREYSRLRTLGSDKQLVMDFGFWSWAAIPLLSTMNLIHRFTMNYGVAIILLTLLIKTLFWPLQSSANRTMKKMQALAPKLKELQEKYKENPEKLNVETMGMYRDYGVNPLGGCLPMLIQIPVFFGFYSMLQTAVELRYSSFLWAHDLAQPDTVAHLPVLGWPVNPLPILMGLSSLWQMSMTPNSSMDKTQAMMFKFMPLFFVAICYNFSSALALYWTVQNLVGVVQLYYNNSQPAVELTKPKKPPQGRWALMMENASKQAAEQERKRKKK